MYVCIKQKLQSDLTEIILYFNYKLTTVLLSTTKLIKAVFLLIWPLEGRLFNYSIQ